MPATHRVQSGEAEAVEYLPGSHSVHVDCPAGEYCPVAQGPQSAAEVLPVPLDCVPATHALQVTPCGTLWKVPTPQIKQLVEPD